MREIGEPFLSESIWTEAVLDLIARGGRTRSGSEVFNPEDLPGTKASKIMKHLVEAQMPFSLNQLARIDRSIKEVDVVTKFPGVKKLIGGDDVVSEYGQTYEFGPEFAGLFGFRAVELDPGKSIAFKIADYQNGVSDARKLFTTNTLKGGRIEPYEIVDAFINANRALFDVRKEMKNDIEAAKLLGLGGVDFEKAVEGRLTKSDLRGLVDGLFRPLTISKGIQRKFQTNAENLAAKSDQPVDNPFLKTIPVIQGIQQFLLQYDLNDDFPFIENPLLPKPGGPDAASLPAGVNTAPINANVLSSQVQQTDSTNAERFATLFPNG